MSAVPFINLRAAMRHGSNRIAALPTLMLSGL
jgi:hypothetical protein